MFPSSNNVTAAFAAHYKYYANMRGIAAESAANGEAAVSRQYAGRVAFELLQNALDRASSRAMIRRDGNRLVVANDGRAVTCDPSFRFEQPISEGNKPSDFHSLCSMHTSNKNPDDDNGNKGVGFRSVFSVASRVYVWSRLESGGWWGIMMVRDLGTDAWLAAANEPEVAAGLSTFLPLASASPLAAGERRPSFHFPLPLWSPVPPVADAGWAHTVLVLPCDAEGAERSIGDSIASLRASHLEFVGLREKPVISVQIENDLTLTTALSERVVARWNIKAVDGLPRDPLFAAAAKAGLDLKKHVGGGVRWPEPGGQAVGKVYCYLATEVACPFGIDIHADLQTGIDRKHLEVKASEAVGAYNRELLMRGLEQHLAQVEAHAADREDLWRMLDPGPGLASVKPDSEPVRHLLGTHMAKLLFGSWPTFDAQSWARWASLAARSFNGPQRPVTSYQQFWTATEHWINALYGSGTANARKLAGACLTALRATGARVVPITQQGGEDIIGVVQESVPPPVPGEANTKSAEKLFHATQAQLELFRVLPAVPAAVARRGRRVTGWVFPEPFREGDRLIGSVSFQRPALLQELRQLSPKLGNEIADDLHADPVQGADRQHELIAFAAAVYLLRVQEGQGTKSYADESWVPGWRADEDKPSDRFAAGRALATMFLPTSAGAWEPARQLALDEVAPSLRDELVRRVPDFTTDSFESFLGFLGVAVWPGQLRLVESGDDGVVAPRARPPALCDAATGHAIPPLCVPISREGDLSTLRGRLDRAWDAGWLQSLARREQERPHRLNACKRLGEHPWYPVGDADGLALPPRGLASRPAVVSPRLLTLLPGHFQRAADAVWRTKAGTREGWLRALGARGLDERLNTPFLAAELIRELAGTYPDVASSVREQATLRFVLLELFTRALDTVVKHAVTVPWAPDLPLLAEGPAPTGRGTVLRWVRPAEVRVAPDNPLREVVRRHAPDLVLLVAAVGRTQAKGTPVEVRTIKVQPTIVAEDMVIDDGVNELGAELWALLPRLLAVAEVSRRYNRVVDAGNVAEQWRQLAIFRSADVWRRWTISGTDLSREAPERKGKYDDVMYEDDRKGEPVGASRIYYDVAPERLAEHPRPALTQFAEALADILLDRAIEPDWRAALGEYEAGDLARLDDYLDRLGVRSELVEAMQAGLAPLDDSLLAAHRAVVVDVLAGFGLDLVDPAWNANRARTLLLGTHVRLGVGGRADSTEEQVDKALREALYEGDASRFIPTFSASSFYLDAWKRFVGTDQLELRILRETHDRRYGGQGPRDEDLVAGPLADELLAFVRTRAGNLSFDPEAVAWSWLGIPHAGRRLEEWLPKIGLFKPVTAAPALAVWSALIAHEVRPSTSTATPPTKDERDAVDAKKAEKGDGAEDALLKWVVPRTRELLARFGEAARLALLGAFPATGLARERMEKAGFGTDESALREALWVSRRWRGSGFDIVGLDLDAEGRVMVARHEVKSLPDSDRVRLFISANELAVYRATRRPGTAIRADLRCGIWNLVGVRQNGEALILTGALAPVLDPASGGLGALKVSGFSPDDLQLVVRIEAAPVAADVTSIRI